MLGIPLARHCQHRWIVDTNVMSFYSPSDRKCASGLKIIPLMSLETYYYKSQDQESPKRLEFRWSYYQYRRKMVSYLVYFRNIISRLIRKLRSVRQYHLEIIWLSWSPKKSARKYFPFLTVAMQIVYGNDDRLFYLENKRVMQTKSYILRFAI